MPFTGDQVLVPGKKIWNGEASEVKKIDLSFTADGTGAVGSKTVTFDGLLIGVATTDSMSVIVGDTDGVNLIGDAGSGLAGRYTFPSPVPVVGGLTVEVSSAPASASNKVVLYVR